jgi:hypothetical protein
LCSSSSSADGQSPRPPPVPPYFHRGRALDLSSLCAATPTQDVVCQALVQAGPLPAEALSTLLQHSTLDRSQIDALWAALTQQVAVIQGPPGTGKYEQCLMLMVVLSVCM